MAADKIIRNSKLDTFLSKLATKLASIFWRKAETTQVSIDSTPTANSTNLVNSGGVKSYVDNAIPSVPTALSQLSDDSTHRLVTDTEKNTWNGKQNALTFDSTPTANSTNPVTSGGVKAYVDGAIPAVPDDLDDLSDVNLGTPSNGDVLTYDSTTGKWVADTPSGGELSTDVVADKNSNVKASTPKSVYDFVKPQSQSSIPAGGLQPGILYNLSVLTGSVTIDLATPADANVANEYAFTFTAGSTAPSITWPSGIIGWGGNCIDSNGVPEIKAGMFYEVSILNGIALIAEVEV